MGVRSAVGVLEGLQAGWTNVSIALDLPRATVRYARGSAFLQRDQLEGDRRKR